MSSADFRYWAPAPLTDLATKTAHRAGGVAPNPHKVSSQKAGGAGDNSCLLLVGRCKKSDCAWKNGAFFRNDAGLRALCSNGTQAACEL
jgi:hypothetical protein